MWKRLLLGNVAITIIVLPMVVLAHQPRGFYIASTAGASIQQNSRIKKSNIILDTSSVSGTSGFLSGGFAFQSGLRTELEIGYRRNELDFTNNLNLHSMPKGGRATAISAMSNLLYDFHNSSDFIPYLGVGFGCTRVGFDNIIIPEDHSLNTSGLISAYQGIAGVGYAITNTLYSFANYHYFSALEAKSLTNDNHPVDVVYDNNHSITFGLRWFVGIQKPQSGVTLLHPLLVTPTQVTLPRMLRSMLPK